MFTSLSSLNDSSTHRPAESRIIPEARSQADRAISVQHNSGGTVKSLQSFEAILRQNSNKPDPSAALTKAETDHGGKPERGDGNQIEPGSAAHAF